MAVLADSQYLQNIDEYVQDENKIVRLIKDASGISKLCNQRYALGNVQMAQ